MNLTTALDTELCDNGLYTLRGWQQEERTLEQERSEFTRRIKSLKNRHVAEFNGCLLLEPSNESELFGILTTLVGVRPEVFDFEPLDYNTTKGIDSIVRDKRTVLDEQNMGYAELKFHLFPKFNHAFIYLRWIICWDFGANVNVEMRLEDITETDTRRLTVEQDEFGRNIYALERANAPNKIHVIRLKEFIKDRLGIEFTRREAT